MSTWWDDDPELLDATLELLAAWDSGDSAPLPLPSPLPSALRSPFSPGNSTSSTAASERDGSSRRHRSANASRERRNQELQFLRKEADDMERQLSELRARREAQLQPHFRDAQHKQLATVAPVWEGLATRQFRARKQSELRNAKLKTLLSAQVRVAEDLMRVIRHAEQSTHSATPAIMSPVRTPRNVSQRLSEEDHLRRLDVLCANWTHAFAKCDKFAPRGALRFLDMHVVEDSVNETVVELFSSSVLPYTLARVEEAMWNLFLQDEDTDEDTGDSFSQTCTSTDDLIIAAFSAMSTLDDGLRGAMYGKFVTKRFRPSATQTVMVTHTQSKPQGYEGHLDGVETFEDAWVRLVDAVDLANEQLGGPLTVVQHVRRVRIVVRGVADTDVGNEDAVTTRSRVETVTRIVKNQIREEIDWAQQTVENVLTAGSAAGGRPRGAPQ